MKKRIKIQNGTAQPREEEATKLVEVLDIPGSPFKAIKKEEKWFIAWGGYKLTTDQDTYLDCLRIMEENMWQIIGTYTIAMMHEYEKSIRMEIREMIEQ